MAKEIIEKESSKKNNKNLSWATPSKLKNALKANSPEEEYLANCNLEIEETEKKLKEKREEFEEAREELPDYKEIALENFSVRKLSEILSDDELAIVKKWRKSSEYDDDYYDLIKKICEWVRKLPDEEKIVVSSYLQKKNILLLGLGGNDSLGFYYTDFPDEMDNVDTITSNLRKLWIYDFIKFVWDSCYRIDDELYRNAKEKIARENASNEEKESQRKFDDLAKERKTLESALESLNKRKSAVEKYGLPENEAISLYQWSENLDYWFHDEVYNKENHVCVVLNEYSKDTGTWGCEYWTIINIKRGKNEISKRFKYRDGEDSKYNNDNYEYKDIKSVKVDWDEVKVTVSSHESTDTYTFKIAYKEVKESLKSAEKKELIEAIKKVEKELIDKNTKRETYPASYNLSMRKVPWAFEKAYELNYEDAKIIYEDINPESWVAHIILLKHADATWDMGRQYWLIKYVATPEWAANVWEFFYWEAQLRDGDIDKKKLEEYKHW